MKNFLIGILLVLVIIFGCLAFKNRTGTDDSSVVIKSNNQANTVNNLPSKNESDDDLLTENADGYSFKYDKTATVETQTNDSGTVFYNVYKVGGVIESIRLFDSIITNFEAFCGKKINTYTITLQGKKFTYCDSKAEPARTYFYSKNGRTIVLNTQGTSENIYSYIVPESIEIK